MKVMCGVLQTRIGKTLATQAATVAFTTRKTLLGCLIAGDGNRIVYPQRYASEDNVTFSQCHQRRVYRDFLSLDPCPRREIGHRLKRCNVFRTTIRITGIIHRIHANKDIVRTQHLRPA